MADTSRSVKSIINELGKDWDIFLKAKLLCNNPSHNIYTSPEAYFNEFEARYIRSEGMGPKKAWSESILRDETLKKTVYDYFDYLKDQHMYAFAIPAAETRLRSAVEGITEGSSLVRVKDSRGTGYTYKSLFEYIYLPIRDKLIEDKIYDNTLFMAECFEKDKEFYRCILQDIYSPLLTHETESHTGKLIALRTSIINIITSYFSRLSQSQEVGSTLSLFSARLHILEEIKKEISKTNNSITLLPFQRSTTKNLLEICLKKLNTINISRDNFSIEWTVAFNTPLKAEPKKPVFSKEILNRRVEVRTSPVRNSADASSSSSSSSNPVIRKPQNGSYSNNGSSSSRISSERHITRMPTSSSRQTATGKRYTSDAPLTVDFFDEDDFAAELAELERLTVLESSNNLTRYSSGRQTATGKSYTSDAPLTVDFFDEDDFAAELAELERLTVLESSNNLTRHSSGANSSSNRASSSRSVSTASSSIPSSSKNGSQSQTRGTRNNPQRSLDERDPVSANERSVETQRRLWAEAEARKRAEQVAMAPLTVSFSDSDDESSEEDLYDAPPKRQAGQASTLPVPSSSSSSSSNAPVSPNEAPLFNRLFGVGKGPQRVPSAPPLPSSSSSSSSSASANSNQTPLFRSLFGGGERKAPQSAPSTSVAESSSSNGSVSSNPVTTLASEKSNSPKGKEKMEYSQEIPDYIATVNRRLAELGYETLPDALEANGIEIDENSHYYCSISLDAPKIPVLLNGKVYCLLALDALPVDKNGQRIDPIYDKPFSLSDLQFGLDLVFNPLMRKIAKAKEKQANQSSTSSVEELSAQYAPSAPTYEESIGNIPKQNTSARPSSPVSSSFPGFAHPVRGETSSHGNGYPAPDLVGERKTFGR